MRNSYLTICLFLFVQGYGQSTLRPNIYYKDMNYYNPAATATDSVHSQAISLYGKHKFVNNESVIWNKPANLMLNYQSKIKGSNSFYSLSYISDQYSFYHRNTLYAGYGYVKDLGTFGSVNIGGRIVANLDRINWNNLKLPHNETGKSIKLNPDIDLGVRYQLKRFRAGFSVKNTIGSVTKLKNKELLKNRREFYFNTSYEFSLFKKIKVAPYLLVQHERRTVLDGGLYLSILDKVNVSYLLRLNELRGIYMLNMNIYKELNIGIAIDRSKLFSDNNLDVVVRYKF